MHSEVSIDLIDPKDVGTIAHLHNEIFRPERTPERIARRLDGRKNVLVLAANHKNDAIGFYVGFELKPATHFAWMVGVRQDWRRQQVASRLMEYAANWAARQGHNTMRFECHNGHRAILHFGISAGYEIVGLRWDLDSGQNLVIFEKIIGTGDHTGEAGGAAG